VEDRPLDDDDALVARAKRGDRRAFETIVERNQGIVFRTAWLITRSRENAQEVAQDAFLKAYRALDRFRQGAPLRPWLLTIAANEARNPPTPANSDTRMLGWKSAAAADDEAQSLLRIFRDLERRQRAGEFDDPVGSEAATPARKSVPIGPIEVARFPVE
jgi:RNA polymerase sigma factor (sigma-70 family)